MLSQCQSLLYKHVSTPICFFARALFYAFISFSVKFVCLCYRYFSAAEIIIVKHLIQGLNNKAYVRIESVRQSPPLTMVVVETTLHPLRHTCFIWALHRYDYRATKGGLRTVHKPSFRVIFQKAFNALFQIVVSFDAEKAKNQRLRKNIFTKLSSIFSCFRENHSFIYF